MKSMLNKVVALSMLLAIGGQVVAGCKNGQCNVRRQPVRAAKNVRVAPARNVRRAVAPKASVVKSAPVVVAPKAMTAPVKQAPVNSSRVARFTTAMKNSGSRVVTSVKNGTNSAWSFVSNHAKKLIASAAVVAGTATYVIKNEKANTAVKSFLNSVATNAAYH